MTNILAINDAAAAVCPIDGVAGPLPQAPGLFEAADGSYWRVDTTAAATPLQKANLAVAIVNVNPSAVPKPKVTYLQFEALFTPAEQGAIFGAAGTTPSLMQWLLRAAGAGEIDLGNPETIAGINILEGAGLLTADRTALVLAGTPPNG